MKSSENKYKSNKKIDKSLLVMPPVGKKVVYKDTRAQFIQTTTDYRIALLTPGTNWCITFGGEQGILHKDIESTFFGPYRCEVCDLSTDKLKNAVVLKPEESVSINTFWNSLTLEPFKQWLIQNHPEVENVENELNYIENFVKFNGVCIKDLIHYIESRIEENKFESCITLEEASKLKEMIFNLIDYKGEPYENINKRWTENIVALGWNENLRYFCTKLSYRTMQALGSQNEENCQFLYDIIRCRNFYMKREPSDFLSIGKLLCKNKNKISIDDLTRTFCKVTYGDGMFEDVSLDRLFTNLSEDEMKLSSKCQNIKLARDFNGETFVVLQNGYKDYYKYVFSRINFLVYKYGKFYLPHKEIAVRRKYKAKKLEM